VFSLVVYARRNPIDGLCKLPVVRVRVATDRECRGAVPGKLLGGLYGRAALDHTCDEVVPQGVEIDLPPH